MSSDVGLVRHEQNGDPFFPVEALKNFYDLLACRTIQRSGRLIGQQKQGFVHKSAGNRYALLFPTRELGWAAPSQIPEP